MLYGWLEVGASNVPVFLSQCNQDIILRSTNSNNKIMIGNQIYPITSGSNIAAGAYIVNNNIGVNRLPDSNIQLDVNSNIRLNNTLYFTECVNGVENQTAYFVNSNNALNLYYNEARKCYFTYSNGVQFFDKIYNTSDIYAPAFNVLSDSNFKRDVIESDKDYDANLLSNINIYDYRFVNQNIPTKGFIAQQVEQHFPQCIQKTMGFIPCSLTSVFVNKDGHITKTVLPFDINIGEKIVIQIAPTQYIPTASPSVFLQPSQTAELIVYKIEGDIVYVSGKPIYMGNKINIVGKNGVVRTIDTNQLLAVCFNNTKKLKEDIAEMKIKMARIEAQLETLIPI